MTKAKTTKPKAKTTKPKMTKPKKSRVRSLLDAEELREMVIQLQVDLVAMREERNLVRAAMNRLCVAWVQRKLPVDDALIDAVGILQAMNSAGHPIAPVLSEALWPSTLRNLRPR